VRIIVRKSARVGQVGEDRRACPARGKLNGEYRRTRRHPRDDPRAEVGEEAHVGVSVDVGVRVGPVEFQLISTRQGVRRDAAAVAVAAGSRACGRGNAVGLTSIDPRPRADSYLVDGDDGACVLCQPATFCCWCCGSYSRCCAVAIARRGTRTEVVVDRRRRPPTDVDVFEADRQLTPRTSSTSASRCRHSHSYDDDDDNYALQYRHQLNRRPARSLIHREVTTC